MLLEHWKVTQFADGSALFRQMAETRANPNTGAKLYYTMRVGPGATCTAEWLEGNRWPGQTADELNATRNP